MRAWIPRLILLLLVLLAAAGIGVLADYATNYVRAVSRSFFDPADCGPDEPPCAWSPTDLPEPDPAPGWDPAACAYCLDLAGRAEAVETGGDVPVLPPGLRLVLSLPGVGPDDPPLGFVAAGEASGACYVAFRGTDRRRMREWMSDLSFGLERPAFAGDGGARVHAGFLRTYMRVRDAMLDAIRGSARPGAPVWIAGHSMGGAVGAIAAYDMSAFPDARPLRLYTFGAPKAGGHGLRDRFASIGTEALTACAVQNLDDVVPTLPLASNPNSAAPNQPLVYDQPCPVRALFSANRGCLALNHSLATYKTEAAMYVRFG